MLNRIFKQIEAYQREHFRSPGCLHIAPSVRDALLREVDIDVLPRMLFGVLVYVDERLDDDTVLLRVFPYQPVRAA